MGPITMNLVNGSPIDLYAYPEEDMTEKAMADMKDVNWVNKVGYPRLHMAVKSNMPSAVERLLLRNACCLLKDHQNNTAVRIAVEFGYTEIVKLFCSAGVDMDALEHTSTRNHDSLPLFMCAVDNSHLDVVKVLIEHGMDPSVKLPDGTSSLHLAAQCDFDMKMMRILINTGIDVNMQTRDKVTALGLASRSDNLVGMKLLLDKGADVNVQDIDGNTPLHLALLSGYKKNLQLLLEHGADMYAKSNSGASVLHSAAYTRVTCMATLIRYGVDLERRDTEGKTAFLHAVKYRNYDVVRLLMATGVDMSVRDMYHNTAMHFAANDGDSELIQAILRSGVSVPEQNFDYKTPLQLAVEAEGPILEMFEKRGAWVNHQECQTVFRVAMG